MKKVPFVQYLRPNGRKKEVWTEVPDELAEKVDQIIAKNYHFTAEDLGNGWARFTVSDNALDYIERVVPNGPPVVKAVQSMIQSFDFERARIMKEEELG